MSLVTDAVEPNVPAQAEGVRLTGTARVEAFSDGVLAIAITLLILDVRLPATGSHGSLLHQLVHLWPAYLAYADSFLAIGVVWLCHHAFFSRIRHVDASLAWANLALLLTVAFVPFPTAVLADNLTKPGSNARVAAAFYGVVAAAQAAAWLGMWAALRRRPSLFEPGFDAPYARSESRMAWAGVVLFLGCAAVGLLSPLASLTLYVLVVLAYGLTTSGLKPLQAGVRRRVRTFRGRFERDDLPDT
jgi:uncharacterized membrane protein